MSESLTGNDSVLIGARGAALRIFKDLADGDTAVLDFPNNLTEAKVGKNGNTIFAFNSTGKTVTTTIRTILGSPDDKYLNARLNEYINDSASFILLDGEFVKRSGDGTGSVSNIIYQLFGGVIQKMPNVKENVEGDTEQAVSVWQIIFANTDRTVA